ncbi:MAG: helix-turn-helix domain-containing protein [Desulfovibrionaceae bacterium]|nr:helix-turn-helix domain-containing protein [Desulfovibrionaceae bacterium]
MYKATYTLSEAANLLSCHKETLRRAIIDGQLQAARLGRGWRISRMDLETFWSSKGGGELFPKEELISTMAEDAEPELSQAKKKAERKNKPEQTQLFLPTAHLVNDNEQE